MFQHPRVRRAHVAILLATATVLLAKPSPGAELRRPTFSSGAVATTGSGRILMATIGEVGLVGDVSDGTRRLRAGFWPAIPLDVVVAAPGVQDEWIDAVGGTYPNPFRVATTLSFSTARTENVTVTIYDLAGRRVATVLDGSVPAGSHRVAWNGRDDLGSPTASGVYLYRVDLGSFVATRKVLKLR